MRRLTTEEFIQKARKVHGDKYDYSLSTYTTAKQKVQIICPKHGIFEQSPDGHLRGQGCPQCKAEKTSIRCKKDIEVFIEEAQKVHNNKYNYSKFNYVSAHVKGIIICPEHGEFEQSPANHLAGKGCPDCAKSKMSKGEAIVKNYLDKNNIAYKKQYRIKFPKEIRISEYGYIDFYLPEHNIFIEYNGAQHYIPVEHFGGEIKLQDQQIRDEYVKWYCYLNGIRFLEIPYNTNNIEDTIENFIYSNEEEYSPISKIPEFVYYHHDNNEQQNNEYVLMPKEYFYKLLTK